MGVRTKQHPLGLGQVHSATHRNNARQDKKLFFQHTDPTEPETSSLGADELRKTNKPPERDPERSLRGREARSIPFSEKKASAIYTFQDSSQTSISHQTAAVRAICSSAFCLKFPSTIFLDLLSTSSCLWLRNPLPLYPV